MLSDEKSPLVITQLTPFNHSHATDVPTPAVSSWDLGQLFIGDKVKFVYIKEFTLAHNYNTLFLIKKILTCRYLGRVRFPGFLVQVPWGAIAWPSGAFSGAVRRLCFPCSFPHLAAGISGTHHLHKQHNPLLPQLCDKTSHIQKRVW